MSRTRRTPRWLTAALLLVMVGIAGCRADPPPDAAHASPTGPAAVPTDGAATPSSPGEDEAATADDATPTKPPADAAPSPVDRADPADVAQPVSVTVPSVGIHGELVRLGLHADGTMEVPDDFDLAGWYVHAPRPGEIGPAIIAGHVDSTSGPAVFYRLREVAEGDRVEVARADGSVAVFSVDALEQYPKDEFPTTRVYGDLDHAGLRLITCGGEFDRADGHYRDNIIVYASIADD